MEGAAACTDDDIQFQGNFERALELIAFARKILDNLIDIFCLDTQGPFDLAHLLLGDQIFYLMMDDPSLMHRIMELCTTLYIRCTEAVKKSTGEPNGECVHGCRLYVPNAGIRICEDTTTLIGRAAMEEFALPYTLRAAAAFGGAWIHFCGRCDELRDAVCECEDVRGVNYGIVPSKEDDFDFDEEIRTLSRHGKVYYGNIPRCAGETGADYLRRLHDYAETGSLLAFGDPALRGENGFANAGDALEFWYGLG